MNFFVFVVLGLINLLATSTIANDQCPQHCVCDVQNNEQIISCSKDASTLTITVSETIYGSSSFFESDKRGNKLTINCLTYDQFAYEIGSSLNVSNLIGLEYDGCPLPAEGSLSLGFSDLYGIRFTSERANETFTSRHFDGLTSLNELRLISNTTTFHLTDDAFAGFQGLRRLYLHSKEIHFKAFEPLERVTKLEIGFVSGEFNLDGLQNLKRLEQVNVASMQIDHLSKRIFENLPESVDTIMLYDNDINIIDADVFAAVSNLNYLRFADNTIQHFPSHFNITSRNFLYFQLLGNHASISDEMLSNLPDLRDVDIHCNLESVPENLFKDSYNLNILNLTGNRLTDLPENLLANQTGLFHLYLDQNRFEVLPENLIKNLLTKPRWVSSVLFIFSFKSNRIRSISEDDWRLLLEKDADYDFSDNLLEDFSILNTFGDTFARSRSFYIFNDNPIICDCEKIATLRKYLKNEKRVWRFSYNNNDAKCASPAELKGIKVADVECN